MSNQRYDIRDDEFRFISERRVLERNSPAEQPAQKPGRKTSWLLIPLMILGIAILAIILWPKKAIPEPRIGLFEEQAETPAAPATSGLLGTDTGQSFTEKLDTVINDVRLALYLPHNARPELTLGIPDTGEPGIILAAQAADIRADNRKILGAFVLKGEPLAWGLSKKGYCAIIEGEVFVGVSENSPLFEEATEKEGFFFRQYPLVDNGTLVENGPKNKTMRKALCSRDDQIFIAVSETDESMHDFAQALVDLGVENAIYLVGSHSAFGWFVDSNGDKTLFAPDVHRQTYKNENYIVWRVGE